MKEYKLDEIKELDTQYDKEFEKLTDTSNLLMDLLALTNYLKIYKSATEVNPKKIMEQIDKQINVFGVDVKFVWLEKRFSYNVFNDNEIELKEWVESILSCFNQPMVLLKSWYNKWNNYFEIEIDTKQNYDKIVSATYKELDKTQKAYEKAKKEYGDFNATK